MNKTLKMIALIAAGMVAVGLAVGLIGHYLGGGYFGMEALRYEEAFGSFPRRNDRLSDEKTLEAFSGIDVEADYIELELEPSETDQWTVAYLCEGGLQAPEISVEQGTLRVRADSPVGWNLKNGRYPSRRLVRIGYPKNASFQEVKVDAKAAELSAEGFFAEKLLLDFSAGEIEMTRVEAKEATLKVQAGNVELDSCTLHRSQFKMNAGNLVSEGLRSESLDIRVQMGNIELEGSLTGQTKLEVSMGNISLALREPKDSYALELSATAGEVVVDERGEGRRYDTQKGESGKNEISAQVQAGSVRVAFE